MTQGAPRRQEVQAGTLAACQFPECRPRSRSNWTVLEREQAIEDDLQFLGVSPAAKRHAGPNSQELRRL